jgi:hypothetical protein
MSVIIKMTITFVTAFYAPSSPVYRSTEFYVSMFEHLASTDLPILLFLDKTLREQGERLLGQYPNIRIEYTTLEKPWLPDNELVLPATRTHTKDTIEYFHVQLSKLRHLSQASQMVDTTHLAWIDFGIFHVMNDKDYAKQLLQQIYEIKLPLNTVFSPGCWDPRTKNEYFEHDEIEWYHCGGFMVGDAKRFSDLCEKQDALVKRHLPILTWEVNYWAMMLSDFVIYAADHDETMLSEIINCGPQLLLMNEKRLS